MFDNQIETFNNFLLEYDSLSFGLLLLFGFLAGLLSSLLPCVLSLLPLNLAYIGTLKIDNKLEALKKSSLFVLGVSIVLTCLGVFGNLAFAIFTEYRSLINIAVGLVVLLMAFSLSGLFKLPMPQIFKTMPETNPLVVGMIFALVSSPCSSPLLISILSVGASFSSLWQSLLLLFGYSLGYTAIIFFASLSAGLVKQLNVFKTHSDLMVKISSICLALLGGFYLIVGLQALFS